MAEKRLTKAQKDALVAIEAAQDTEALTAAVRDLKPEERNDKRVGWPVHQATQRIVNQYI